MMLGSAVGRQSVFGTNFFELAFDVFLIVNLILARYHDIYILEQVLTLRTLHLI